MLVAEGDLEEQHALSVALETKVSRLDDPGVHRADRDFVDLVAVHPEEVRRARSRACPEEPDRLEPGVPLRDEGKTLGDLPLEEVRLRALGVSAR
jgi:hypothetical protein